MNAEVRNLGELDRYNLIQTDEQVDCVLSQCRFLEMKIQPLLTGDPNIPMNEFQKEFIDDISCMVCK